MGFQSPNGHHIDLAIEHVNKGDEVVFLGCDKSLGMCILNTYKNPIYCNLCKKCGAMEVKRLAPPNCKTIWIKEYVDRTSNIKRPIFDYTNAQQLRALEYNGIAIGLGVMSTYISLTRNLNPVINNESKKYFDELIDEQIRFSNALDLLQKEENFDLFIFQNGRGVNVRPLLNFCQRENIEYLCTEFIKGPTEIFKDDYKDTIPHSIAARTKKYLSFWDNSNDSEDVKEEIGKSFFENRRNSKPAADKIYTNAQVMGMMPEDWNPNIQNIVIFNSSEDEFSAIGGEFDKEAFFESQIVGITTIVKHYENNPNIHFTLRIHPNLKDIPYKYHTDLYKLGFKNLTVIPGNSPISTYALMDAADKILVFGSSTGIEAVYWGKPVINLAGSYYRDFGIVYKPKTMKELWTLLETKDLKCLYNKNILKYGYYLMKNEHETTSKIPLDYHYMNIRGKKKIVCMKYQKLLGSNTLYAIVAKLFSSYFKKLSPAKFSNIPTKEA